MIRAVIALMGLAAFGTCWAQVSVQLRGAVANPGAITLKDGSRLSDAALTAKIQPDAYLLAGAWLRRSARHDQTRLKAGMLFDLDVLGRSAMAGENWHIANAVHDLRAQLADLPVNGRVVAELAPRVVEVTPAIDWPVANGDTLYYPTRPSTVRVMGAVRAPCTLPFAPLRDARQYLASCASSAIADRDWAWVIEPDGRFSRLGVAPWNRAAPQALAPGAIVFVPVAAKLVRQDAPQLNHEVAQFLATQILPAAGAEP